MRYSTIIFDLDGTLLDTSEDILSMVNTAFRSFRLPRKTMEEVTAQIGYGYKHLLDSLVPKGTSASNMRNLYDCWLKLHPMMGFQLTIPYQGVKKTLKTLKDDGVKLAIVSNKHDPETQRTIHVLMPDIFDAIHGECAEFPLKPDPTGILKTIEELGGTPETTLVVGDVACDIAAGKAAGCDTVAVTWGYGDKDALEAAGPTATIKKMKELLPLVEG